jgi:SulP family sulfate permease
MPLLAHHHRFARPEGSPKEQEMTTIAMPSDDKKRYAARPSVWTALTSPRILTKEVLAGLVVALALIPEAISFSIIAGVDPRVGLFSSFVMAVSIALGVLGSVG